jgi:2-polyprenyl-3-methyl-5-hydroxy-6-metoxy-1,4-benzoquinol methylase
MKPYQTAISRKQMSKPMTWLHNEGHLHGRILDYGCGHGRDVEELAMLYDIQGWDPHWRNHHFPLMKRYDVVTCIYVLNVVSKEVETQIISSVRSLLKPGGTAYFAVRRDRGKKSRIQRESYPPLTSFYHDANHFEIYSLTKETNDKETT